MTASLHASRHASESCSDPQDQRASRDETGDDVDSDVFDSEAYYPDIANDCEALEVDIRFTDFSDMPLEPEQTRSKAVVGFGTQSRQHTMPNLVTRPESAGNTSYGMFNMMPNDRKLMKRPNRGNTRTNTGLESVVASTIDDEQVIRSCEIQLCEERPNQGLCETGKTQIAKPTACSDDDPLPPTQPEQNAVDKCSADRPVAAAISRLPEEYNHNSQDKSTSVSQVDDQSQDQQPVQDIQSPANDTLVDLSIALEPSIDRMDTITVNDSTETANNRPVTSRNTHSVRRQHETHHVQTAQRDRHRINKSGPVPRVVQMNPDRRAQIDSAAASASGLSEEDLLYFLMYQIRQKDQKNVTVVQQQVHLENKNKMLQNMQETLRKQLEDTEDERDRLTGETENIRNELDLFKNKYKKLKNWALEMNNEYANIRQEGRALKDSLFDLRQENSDMRKPVKDTLASNNAAINTIQNVKKSISETTQSMGVLSGSLKTAHENLASANAEVRVLKDTKDKYELHIRELSASQNRLNLRISSHHSELIKTLDDFNQKLDSTQSRQSEITSIDECIDLVRMLSGKDIATGAGFNDLKRIVNMLGEQLQTFGIKLENSVQVPRSCNASDSLASELEPVLNAIKQLQPDMAKVEIIQHENIRLLEKTKSDLAFRQVIEEEKRRAESHQATTERKNEKLIDSLTQREEYQQNQLSKTARELQTQLSAVTTRWMSASSELKANENKTLLHEQELNRLKQQLKDRESQYTSAEKKQCLQHQQDIELMKKDNTTAEANLRATFEQQIQQLTESEAKSAQALNEIQQEKNSEQEVIHRLQQEKNDLHQTLEVSQQELAKLTIDLNEKINVNHDLEQRFKEACEQAGHATALEQRLAEKCKAINEMKASIGTFNDIEAQLDAALVYSSDKDSEIRQLNDKVAAFEKTTSDLIELGQKVAEQQEELALQRDKLIAAEVTAATLHRTEDELRNNVEDLHQVRKSLEEAQNQCSNLHQAERKVAQLQKDISKLKAELAFKKARKLHESSLEGLIRQQDGKTVNPEKQVSNPGRLEGDSEAVELHLSDKDNQLKARAEEIEELVVQTQRPSQCQAQSQGDDLDELFTQNTNLSMSTSSMPSSRKMSNKDIQVSSVTIQIADSSLLIVDPSALTTSDTMIHPTNLSIVSQVTSSQTSIIPDSQLELVTQLYDNSQSLPVVPLNNRSTSPLTDIDDEFVDSDIEIEDSCPKHVFRGKLHFEEDERDDIFDFPNSSPREPIRGAIATNLPHRPSSAISQEEMLLQSLDGQKNKNPRAMLSPHGHPRSKATTSRGNLAPPQSAQADPVDSNRHRLRSLQRQTADARSNRATPLERALPNSAAKRRIDEVVTGSDERSILKRSRFITVPAESKSSGRLRRTATAEPAPALVDNLPVGSRIGEPPELNVSSTTKNGKRSKNTRKPSKQNRYAEKFSNDS